MSGRKKLTIQQKLEIIKHLNDGESARSVAGKYKINECTVHRIRKQSKGIENYASKLQRTEHNLRKRKSMRCYTDDKLDAAMYEWFSQQRSQGIPLSGPLLREKALEMNQKLGGDQKFVASSGWLRNFKLRHGIRQLTIQGEKLSANSSVVSGFVEKINMEIKSRQLTEEQVYNCDETGLQWKCLPTKTLASGSESSAPGYKTQKERITALVCSNASGKHKLPLAIVGKAKRPRSLKHLNMKVLPLNYFSQKNAWMNQDIFCEWFHKSFVPDVCRHLKENNLPEEAMLIMDNARVHPIENLNSKDSKITCHFLPPNTTPLIQPMDQGVIESLKRKYRKGLLRRLLAQEHQGNVLNFWKKYTIKDAIYNIAESWSDIEPQIIKKCWYKLWPQESDPSEDMKLDETNDDMQLLKMCSLVNDLDNSEDNITAWLTIDKYDKGYEILNDDTIVQNVVNPTYGETESDCDEEMVAGDIPSHKEVANMASQCIKWLEMQEEVDEIQLAGLCKLRNLALQKAFRQ